jgi:hypothetical protein
MKSFNEGKLTESMIGIQTKANFKPLQLKGALERAGMKGFQMNRLSVTLTALKLDKKYYKDAVKIVDDLGLKVMMAKESVNEATIELDAMEPKAKGFLKLLKKKNVKLDIVSNKGPAGWPVVKLTGKRKDLEAVVADPNYGWDDAELGEFIKESKSTEKKMNKNTLLRKIVKEEFDKIQLTEGFATWKMSFVKMNLSGVKLDPKNVYTVKARSTVEAIKKASKAAGLSGDDWMATQTHKLEKVG